MKMRMLLLGPVVLLTAALGIFTASPASAAVNPNYCSKSTSGSDTAIAYCSPAGGHGFYQVVAKCEGWTLSGGSYVDYKYGNKVAPGSTSTVKCATNGKVTWTSISFS